jgi:hypothetical protein
MAVQNLKNPALFVRMRAHGCASVHRNTPTTGQDAVKQAARNAELPHHVLVVSPIEPSPHSRIAHSPIIPLWHIPPTNARRETSSHGIRQGINVLGLHVVAKGRQAAVSVALDQNASHVMAQRGTIFAQRFMHGGRSSIHHLIGRQLLGLAEGYGELVHGGW